VDFVALEVEHSFRRESARITASLARSFGMRSIDDIEDCVQESFVRALRVWPVQGVPRRPTAWLFEVARNALVDRLRHRSRWIATCDPPEIEFASQPPARFDAEIGDDRLNLLFACCHPALSDDARLVLTLKLGAGFSVGEIARAVLGNAKTVAQSLVRSKARLRELNVEPRAPGPDEFGPRLQTVLTVVYLIFNEGYFATEGADLIRRELCDEAIRLVELLAGNPRTAGPEVHALAALLLFQGARIPARIDAAGELLLLADQDRSLWDRAMIARGLGHFQAAAQGDRIGPFHVEAELAAYHTLAPSFEQTDWAAVVDAYDRLLRFKPGNVVALNRAIAVGYAAGADAGLREIEPLLSDRGLAGYYPLHAAHARFLRERGDAAAAVAAYDRAIDCCPAAAVQRHSRREALMALRHVDAASRRADRRPE
jgi:RNA polymerase sigma-70 factor (ECF subfamily)